MDGKSRVVVRIMGKEYPILSGDSQEHVRWVANVVDQKMRTIASNGTHSIDRVAVLAALTLADELYKLQEQSVKDREEMRQMRAQLDRLSQQPPVVIAQSDNDGEPRSQRGPGRSKPRV